MNRVRWLVSTAALAVAATIASPIARADAATPPGADVTLGVTCVVNTDDTGLPEDLITTRTIRVVTPNGTALTSCHYKVPPEWTPTPARLNSGFLCVTFAGFTTDSEIRVTPGGVVVLTCHLNGSSPTPP